MPTENYYPYATHTTGDYEGYSACCSNKSNEMRPTSPARTGALTANDVDWNFYNTYQVWGYQVWLLDWPDGPIASFNSGNVYTSHRHDNAGNTARNMYFFNPTDTFGTAFHNTQDSDTNFVTRGPTALSTSNNPGGLAWTAQHVDKTNTTTRRWAASTCYPDASALATGNFSSFWGDITYSPPAGGFTFLLQLAGLSALPFVGKVLDVVQFNKYLSWRSLYHPRQTKLSDEERVIAFREFGEYTHPTFFHMGAV